MPTKPAQPRFEHGHRLGRYELIECIGGGGFGEVYRARQLGDLEHDVAVKVLLPRETPAAFDAAERFGQEARVISRLEHPNTVKIRDFGATHDGVRYLVTELVSGNNLRRLLRMGPIRPERAVKIGLQVLGSLDEAHRRGIVHRDLKPGNIQVFDVGSSTDVVKVLDFGLAKVSGDSGGLDTLVPMEAGTPWYMSPEQARGQADLDGRSDLYSLGLILSECVSGSRVVGSSGASAALHAHSRTEELEFDPRATRSPLWPIIHQATRKDRAARFPNAAAMARALESVLREGGGRNPVPSWVSDQTEGNLDLPEGSGHGGDSHPSWVLDDTRALAGEDLVGAATQTAPGGVTTAAVVAVAATEVALPSRPIGSAFRSESESIDELVLGGGTSATPHPGRGRLRVVAVAVLAAAIAVAAVWAARVDRRTPAGVESAVAEGTETRSGEGPGGAAVPDPSVDGQAATAAAAAPSVAEHPLGFREPVGPTPSRAVETAQGRIDAAVPVLRQIRLSGQERVSVRLPGGREVCRTPCDLDRLPRVSGSYGPTGTRISRCRSRRPNRARPCASDPWSSRRSWSRRATTTARSPSSGHSGVRAS